MGIIPIFLYIKSPTTVGHSVMNPFLSDKHVIYAVSKSEDGNMSFRWGEKEEVSHNRKVFLEKHQLRTEDCLVMEIEHGAKIVLVDSSYKSLSENTLVSAEALITQEKGLALFLLTADCLPISLYDPIREVIALAHLGWKPTNLKLIEKVIREMTNKFNSNRTELIAHIGPGIHKESYVFEDPIQKTLPEWSPFLHDLSPKETQIDLVSYNKMQMLAAGLREENILIDPADTGASGEYFSHYRSVRTGEPERRFVTVLALK